MANQETSFLYSKKLVYSTPMPLPFCIYEGMCESVYMLANSLAFSTLYSPGIYRVLDASAQQFSQKPLVIDDIFGLLNRPNFYTNIVWTREYISRLVSLRRITWHCNHEEGTPDFFGHDMVIFASPLAFLHKNRLDIACADKLREHPQMWFMLPAGSQEKSAHVVQYYADHLPERAVYHVYIPAAAMDSCWLLITPEGEEVTKAPYSSYILRYNPVPGVGRASVEKERLLYEATYG